MYALIYDQYKPEEREKRVWECNTRIVWVKDRVRAGDNMTPDAFETWAPGERIPYGDLYSDTD